MNEFEIGGYFEFSFNKNNNYQYNDAYHYISARSSFYSFLVESNIKEIYFPRYICDSMIEPLSQIDIKIKWYNLDENLYPIINNNSNGYILYVNYFGICDSNVSKLLDTFPEGKVIVDNSQSFFSEPSKIAAATIYSPRKFFPVPCGGTIVTSKVLKYTGKGRTSLNAVSALVGRYEEDASKGYNAFKNASEELNLLSLKSMPAFTYSLLNDMNFDNFKSIRLKNFTYLDSILRPFNCLELPGISVPLCYPLKLEFDVESIRKKLIDNKIYTPIYWMDAIKRVSMNSIEIGFIKDTLYLPIDQRYSKLEMDIMLDILIGEI